MNDVNWFNAYSDILIKINRTQGQGYTFCVIILIMFVAEGKEE
jgi:hypothetical protein